MTVRRRILTAFVVAVLMVTSCAKARPSVGGFLARIDADPAGAAPDLYLRAAKLARSSEDRLRVLKRSRMAGTHVYADTAGIMIDAGAVSEAVAIAALDAFLEDGRVDRALALFDRLLNPAAFPQAYAETVIRSIRSGLSPRLDTTRLVLCADTTGDARFMVAAAVSAMAAGDTSTAKTLLSDVASRVPVALLWDAGAIEALAGLSLEDRDIQELAIIADAAMLAGRVAEATVLYTRILDERPDWSWKPYAMLARNVPPDEDQAQPPPPLEAATWPYTVPENSYGRTSSGTAMIGRYYDAMMKAFPDNPDARLEYARWLFSVGRVSEAAALSGSVGGEAADILALDIVDDVRVPAEAQRLSGMYPESATALDAALAALARTGQWQAYASLYGANTTRIDATARAWFWNAITALLAGDISGAGELASKFGPQSAGYEGAWNLGVLQLSAGRFAAAASSFETARALAVTAREKAACLVLRGDALLASGEPGAAGASYETALGVDPLSRLARSRLERLQAGKGR